MANVTNTGVGAVPSDRTNRRRGVWRRMQQQEARQNQNPTRRQGAAEAQSNRQLRVPSPQRGRESRGRNNAYSARGRGGSPAHGQSASRNNQSYSGRHHVNAPAPLLSLSYMETVVQQAAHTHLTIDGIGYLQWQSSTTYSINGTPRLVETSSVLTRTESTGWDSMDYSSSMEATTPMSEPPEPWPSHSGGHNFVGAGAQFESENTQLSADHDKSIESTATFDDSFGASGPRPVIIVTSDGQVDVVEPVEVRDDSSAADMAAEIDLLSSLPFDMSRADLDWVKEEDWVNTIPLGLPRAWTFPGVYIPSVGEELVSQYFWLVL
ncbi:hypothetical protein BU25DRAFT_413229 [Macroventuria anomochaeta]|uniref:Uncharacterized protein n=1 Tax=Macroventuria anomochaeta TaxID=301207 RepID=A0ACB6RSC1_9PLEO|nr:uncharacterized protein BU25DRAFT_413229 [Macroventuria anomochaeta]KAF2624679.1 hypothetical protein BU25DRAFT_413229 [Macroventuria anomochaeta]